MPIQLSEAGKAIFVDRPFFSSDEVSPLCAVLTAAQVSGEFAGEIMVRGRVISKFTLEVLDSQAGPVASIDLGNPVETYSIQLNGFVYAFDTTGKGPFSVRIRSLDVVILDNTALKQGDIVIATLYRPGVYEVLDTNEGGRCTVEIEYPNPSMFQATAGKLPAVDVQVLQGKMDPDNVSIEPTRPIKFTVRDGTRIEGTLTVKTDRKDGRLVSQSLKNE